MKSHFDTKKEWYEVNLEVARASQKKMNEVND